MSYSADFKNPVHFGKSTCHKPQSFESLFTWIRQAAMPEFLESSMVTFTFNTFFSSFRSRSFQWKVACLRPSVSSLILYEVQVSWALDKLSCLSLL